eukprot:gnl/TRDRNA2_/TRDRNA2_150898_c0_seq1.p1 gnl/TRDRNA2_/TRDRNA2_150898_c0~~gnl/TRDRNA2_/TRDRNA2_150898_c0_seq1.p1  ORF type:complete len:136 (-),score=11.68 gnl/TRDRNA2_/TRDRNA2_150898_c0_seq1:105-512(-)
MGLMANKTPWDEIFVANGRWMREEVLEKHSDVCRSLCSADGYSVTADADTTAEEGVFVASFRILSPNGIELRTTPASNASVVGRVKASCKLRSRARRGLWLRVVADRGPEGWLLCYRDKEATIEMDRWDVVPYEP